MASNATESDVLRRAAKIARDMVEGWREDALDNTLARAELEAMQEAGREIAEAIESEAASLEKGAAKCPVAWGVTNTP